MCRPLSFCVHSFSCVTLSVERMRHVGSGVAVMHQTHDPNPIVQIASAVRSLLTARTHISGIGRTQLFFFLDLFSLVCYDGNQFHSLFMLFASLSSARWTCARREEGDGASDECQRCDQRNARDQRRGERDGPMNKNGRRRRRKKKRKIKKKQQNRTRTWNDYFFISVSVVAISSFTYFLSLFVFRICCSSAFVRLVSSFAAAVAPRRLRLVSDSDVERFRIHDVDSSRDQR